ncbi:long-chain fatty-acid--CoA ligase [Corynebacterium sp. sy017]|uniref:long-chain fatty-acid--CoA ligase n=1 Tax=unclassified Corynebacterium TaxID=2624378 RepID=UPI001184E1DE|nr:MULTISPECIES: long-chain fatty-acid--CoA ligase [unclassified Corynebacterium]MBP3089004.1 long-chain fatty-acid--CoA ligase [Corynebacterium sp. sy017]TSD91326.1 long-chain fatty-acid--CoA ligase [Corynebacterium sp. SY003]
MLSTMQDLPLNLSRILTHGSTLLGETKVTTWENDTTHETTFAHIGARAAALAHALRDELGIDADQRVGTLMYNCAEHLETLFAVACMGAVFNPLNKQLMNDQIRHIINHAQDQVIIADQRMAKQLGTILAQGCPTVKYVVFIGSNDISAAVAHIPENIICYSYEALLDGRSTDYKWPVLDENTAAALCYSTGSSGAPKGVAYSHRSLYLQSLSLRTTDSMAITHGQSFLCCVPIYHVLSWGVPIAAFMSGTPLVFPSVNVSPASLAKVIAATHPRSAHGVPTIWIQLMVHYMHNPPERMSLQEIFAGGSAVPPMLITLWEEHYGVDVVHVWGMTETSTAITVARPPSGVSGQTRLTYRESQGRFPASIEYRVVNDGEIVSSTDRHQGEIQVRGNWVTGSYYHSPTTDADGIAALFRNEPVDDGPEQFTLDGWLRTGDVGSVTSDGFLTIHDRARDVIRSGGEWIYSTLLENEIMAAPEVVECAVIGHPDEKWMERPLAVTVLAKGIDANAETAALLRDKMRNAFPAWMLPEYWTFVDSIDKTSVGKFDKIDLRKHLNDGDFQVIALPGPGHKAGNKS